MALRNLNRTESRGRILGTPHAGVKGSLIPSTGDYGPGYLYRYLNLPADNDKEYSGYIESIPAGLNIVAEENTRFTASGPDGVYTLKVLWKEDGYWLEPVTFNIVFGATNVTIAGAVGAAVAAGVDAVLSNGSSINALIGDAAAQGLPALITQAGVTTVLPVVGDAVAAGTQAMIQLATAIQAQVGAAAAAGATASVRTGTVGPGLSEEDVARIADAMWQHPTGKSVLRTLNLLLLAAK